MMRTLQSVQRWLALRRTQPRAQVGVVEAGLCKLLIWVSGDSSVHFDHYARLTVTDCSLAPDPEAPEAPVIDVVQAGYFKLLGTI